jgi:hypothetical protein
MEVPHPSIASCTQMLENITLQPSNPVGSQLLPITPLPSFSHTPPSNVQGRHRWPTSLDAQAFPAEKRPALFDILIWVKSFLSPHDNSRVACVAQAYRWGPTFGPLWFYRPWPPNRRRRWGFGTLSRDRTVENDKPPPHLLLHFIWQFLSPFERRTMSKTCSQWHLYASLRRRAVLISVASLHKKRPPPMTVTTLPLDRALLYASALLRFHFYYGDFIRWLGGEYTNRHRQWDKTFDVIQRLRKRQPPKDYPPSDLFRGKQIFTQGVPLKGHFKCPQAEIEPRDRYNNHPAIDANFAAVEEKFAKEEQKSFHIHLPRFLAYFIVGLLINPLQWEWDKGKGRICVDGTNGPEGSNTPGSCNTHIPKPSPDNPDECPPVYYSTALMRFFINVWRLRITFPRHDILMHADDIDAAFRRILYSPEMAILFAYVFGNFLIIPVGQCFGSRSAPSFFSLVSDIRADLATTGSIHEEYQMHQMVSSMTLPLPPAMAALTPATADALNMPMSLEEQENFWNSSFVDDNGICAISDRILPALQQSLLSAFLLFGWPHEDRRSSCMAADKWATEATFVMLFLGYYINSRTLMVTWPLYKREALILAIEDALKNPRQVSPKTAASIMGKVRAAGEIAPWGSYVSFSLADALKRASRAAFHPIRKWWSRGKIRFSRRVIADLKLLMESLRLPEFSPVWSCYIGLLVPRTAMQKFLSDASYEGLGGWSPDFQVQWRLTRQDLIALGFNLKVVNAVSGEPTPEEKGLHINPLEFIAVIINLWLLLILIRSLPPCPTGYIVDLFSDNTSALSWLHYTATTRDPLLQPLARFASALLVQTRRLLTRVQPRHIPGPINIEADALSRFQNGRLTSWEDVIERCSLLKTCRICLLPRSLLSVLADLSSSRPIEGTYDELTTTLLTHELSFLPPGSNLKDIRSSLLPL